ncbi:MAG: nucleotidyltransferase [Candidatus Kryptoniota bacterium]
MRSYFSEDISEFLLLLSIRNVEYVIVGGEAVIYYGHARLTGDIDIFYKRSSENVNQLYAALNEFWGNSIPGVENKDELMQEGIILQFGVPPNRIDLINDIEGVGFDRAWSDRLDAKFPHRGKEVTIHYIGLAELIKNKKAIGRPKDMDDLEFLNKVYEKGKDK